MKNKLFIQGLILAVGQICGKIFSLMFIFLLAQRLKSIGLYLYTYAYIPFSLFLDLVQANINRSSWVNLAKVKTSSST